MSDFAPGDVVVAVGSRADCPDAHLHDGPDVIRGSVFRVCEVDRDPCWAVPGLLLHPSPIVADPWYCVCGFRKIDKADESFTRQIRACRPIRETV